MREGLVHVKMYKIIPLCYIRNQQVFNLLHKCQSTWLPNSICGLDLVLKEYVFGQIKVYKHTQHISYVKQSQKQLARLFIALAENGFY